MHFGAGSVQSDGTLPPPPSPCRLSLPRGLVSIRLQRAVGGIAEKESDRERERERERERDQGGGSFYEEKKKKINQCNKPDSDADEL
ncbi:hypothetical protein JZ751_011081 [Albula glossodonta]|uniref:Uncharacterized protein n=1 Tax=Albula glossodonta TaxID=121402 RepID=A0A8T2NZ46_9TELE|nr:hypothetical protein JZ751_011081 [Albula glossodonta]